MTSTDPLETYSDGVSPKLSTTQWSQNQSIFDRQFESSIHPPTKRLVIKRENSRFFVLKESYPDFSSSEAWNQLAQTLLRCWLVLQTLEESDLKEAIKELEEIIDFYRNRTDLSCRESETTILQS